MCLSSDVCPAKRRSYGKLFRSWFSFRLTSHHHHRHIADCAFAVALLQLTMGLTISSIFGRLFGNQERRILMGACLYCSHLSTSDRGGGGREKRTSNTQHARMPFDLICPWIARDSSADMAHPHTHCCVSMYVCVCVLLHSWAGRCRQDDDLVQAQARRDRDNHSNDWCVKRCWTPAALPVCAPCLCVCVDLSSTRT